MVYIEGNLRGIPSADNFFPLTPNSMYLPKIGDHFFIGRIKAIVGVASMKEYALMRNIINKDLFKVEEMKDVEDKSEEKKSLSQPLPKEKDTSILHESARNIFDNITIEELPHINLIPAPLKEKENEEMIEEKKEGEINRPRDHAPERMMV